MAHLIQAGRERNNEKWDSDQVERDMAHQPTCSVSQAIKPIKGHIVSQHQALILVEVEQLIPPNIPIWSMKHDSCASTRAELNSGKLCRSLWSVETWSVADSRRTT